MDGAASGAFAGNTIQTFAAARMDGAASVQFTAIEAEFGTAQMDGVASAAFGTRIVASAAAAMDGVGAAAFTGDLASLGSAQMDGQGSLDGDGAVGGSKAHMDGAAAFAPHGLVTGGFHIGAAAMDGATSVNWYGVASGIVSAAAEMDGQASMLAVQSGTHLAPHGIILTAGI
jgi:hypothetical protein